MGASAYNLTQIIGPASAVVRNDELWFYYTGTKTRSAGSLSDDYQGPKIEPDNTAICLAILRRDGFVSLEAGMYSELGGPDNGAVLTKPFKMLDSKLLVNLKAPEGRLLVEVLERNGDVLARSAPIRGDHPRAEVTWQQGEFAELTGKAIRLRFTLRLGHLYSYWVD